MNPRLERTDDNTVTDVSADQIYTGSLNNSGESLQLLDPAGNVVDSANGSGGGWPAGTSSPKASMERVSAAQSDTDGNWSTNSGSYGNGSDANGNSIDGTPRQANSTTITPTATATSTVSLTPSFTASPTAAATFTATATSTQTATPTETATFTATPSPTATAVASATPYPALSVVINEIAWAGTDASSSDEWIELYNPGATAISLSNWQLTDGGDVNITLNGTIAAGGYFLLERTDDNTVSNIAAHQIYTGALSNSGESLTLRDSSGASIDTVNADGGSWPGGNSSSRASMERIDSAQSDSDSNWASNDGVNRNGLDASNDPIDGSPLSANSTTITPTPTQTPTNTSSPTISPTSSVTASPSPTATPISYPSRTLVINEVAWAGTTANSADEWIEIHNAGSSAIDLSGWVLTDSGDVEIALSGTIAASGFFLLERTDDSTVANVAADQIYTGNLSNNGESLKLLDPSGGTIDTANIGGGGWPAGDSPSRASMERITAGAADSASNWSTNNGVERNGTDVAGNPILGTPRQGNSTPATATPPATLTPSPTMTATPVSYFTRTIVISEVAWAGTSASSTDEWIELHNPGDEEIHLAGWRLTDGGNIDVLLAGTIQAGGYYLLERTADNTVSDVTADLIYTGGLNNSGEKLTLYDPAGNEIDTANVDGGEWPAGSPSPRVSMERTELHSPDSDANWHSHGRGRRNGTDAGSNPILGTPRQPNSIPLIPTATPTAPPTAGSNAPEPNLNATSVLINEVAWAGTDASSSDEWMELFNSGTVAVDLEGWRLTDSGDIDIALLGVIPAGGYFLLERTDDTTISDFAADLIYTGGLKNDGEQLLLVDPSGNVIDQADGANGGWPAGESDRRASMERVGFGNLGQGSKWTTNTGTLRNGLDANGEPINGTPGQPNAQEGATTIEPLPEVEPSGLETSAQISKAVVVTSTPEQVDGDNSNVTPTATQILFIPTQTPIPVVSGEGRVSFAVHENVEVVVPGGAAVFYMPAGALGIDGVVEIQAVSGGSLTILPFGRLPVRVLAIRIFDASGEPVEHPQFPAGSEATLCFNLEPDDRQIWERSDSSLAVVTFDEKTSQWSPTADPYLDADGKLCTLLEHLSLFALVELVISPVQEAYLQLYRADARRLAIGAVVVVGLSVIVIFIGYVFNRIRDMKNPSHRSVL